MNRQQLYVPLAIAVLAFAVTFAVRRLTRGPQLPAPSRASIANGWRILLPYSIPSPDPAVTSSPVARTFAAPPAGRPPPLPEVPASDDNGPPLPVMLAVSSHPGQVEDEDDPSADPHPVARSVDIANTSSDQLVLTVLAMNEATHNPSHVVVVVRPNGQWHVGTESGLKLEPGDTVTLRSAGYHELTTTVP